MRSVGLCYLFLLMNGFLSDYQRDLIAVAGLSLAVASSVGTISKAAFSKRTIANTASPNSNIGTKVNGYARRPRWERFFAATNAFLFFLAMGFFATLEKRHPWAPYVYINLLLIAWGWVFLWMWLDLSKKPFITLFRKMFFNPIAIIYYLGWVFMGTVKLFEQMQL